MTLAQQIQTLQSRGLIIADTNKAEQALDAISYFRLADYWYHLEADHHTHQFLRNSHFEEVLACYYFDKDLKALLFKAIQTIEVAVRSKIIKHFAPTCGPFWFMDATKAVNQRRFQTNLDTKQTGALLRSLQWRTWNDSGGDRQVFEAKYNYYAKFVELALGRNMPFIGLPPGIPRRKWQPIQMPDGRPRKAKPSIATEMRRQAAKFTTMLEDRYSFAGIAMMVYALGPAIQNKALLEHLLYRERYGRTLRG